MTNKERTDRWINDDDANIPSHFFTDAELARREQAQHTPGPWRVAEDSPSFVESASGRPIANAGVYFDTNASRESRRENAANAALIARAPELAAENERLRGLLAECVAAFDAVIDNQVVTDEQFAAIEAAKEAVK